jgi:translation initiation factor 1 (eIF-1/SUI1)
LTTVQGVPPKFDPKKILKVVKKEYGMFCTLPVE